MGKHHMSQGLYRYFKEPSFIDAEKTRLARILHVILLGFILAALGVIVLNLLLTPADALFRLVTTLLLTALLVGFHVANHHGFVYLVASGLSVLVFAVITVSAAVTTGFGGIGSLGYLVVVLLAGFLIHRRAGILFALAAAITNLILLLAINDSGLSTQSFYEWMIQSIFLIVGAMLLFLVIGSIEQTRKSLLRQSTALRHIEDAVIATDMDGRILTWNMGAEKLYGYTASETVGQSMIHILQTGGDLEQMQAELLAVGRWFGEVQQIRKDGTPVDVQAIVTIIRDDNNQPAGLVAVNRDIALQKALNEQLLYTSQLENRLEQERELTALKDRVLSTVSHDLRTPLSVIQTSIELIQRYPSAQQPEQLQKRLSTIQTQINRMDDLMDEVLTLGKSMSSLDSDHLEWVDIEAFVCMMTSDYRMLNPEHTITCEAASDLPPIFSSRRRLEHIFTNLIGNAIKYTPPPARITIKIQDEGDNISISIRDNGIGIPPDEITRIYDSFYRASNATRAEGTGLGLAIVYHNVQRLGGTLTCQSEMNSGTTFTVHLPHQNHGAESSSV